MNAISSPESANPGAAWIHRFLLTQFRRNFPGRESLECLQLWPDDETEADELERLGHRCVMCSEDEFPNGEFDFVFTGRFRSRREMAEKIYNALKPGGAALIVGGNRLCPIDLSRNGRAAGMTLKEARAIFAAFESVRVLSPVGHFAWQRAPKMIRPLGRVLETFWRIAEKRPALFNSIFNPTLILWLTRK